MNKTQIINKIIEYYKFDSNAAFARFLGIKPQVLSNWKARNTYDIELLSSKCSEINPDWLLRGHGSIKRIKNVDLAVEKTKPTELEQKRIPIINYELNSDLKPTLKSKNDFNYVSFPNVNEIDAATTVINDNMMPKLNVGDLVLYEVLPLKADKIIYGKMYVIAIYIDKEYTYKTIRYIEQSKLGDNYIKLVNENKQYLEKDIELNKVAALGVIKAILCLK
jgi:hypothetical protein